MTKCIACAFDAEPGTAWCTFHHVSAASPTAQAQPDNNKCNITEKEHTMSEDYVLIVVDNGKGNGETLVRIWPSGQVDADWRNGPRESWLPVSLLGGALRCEGADGQPLAGVALELEAERGLESADPDAAMEKWGGDPFQRGSSTRPALGMLLLFATVLAWAIAGPAGNGWIQW